ncbi:tRNA-binding domain-containing protein [Desulfonema limicola]|uniref:tRNA-binding domain-containing protein n=1 Tax=Desulfonema limicola TaxID=45656 RepID=A0A975GJE7_9BACT|nr:hypothetical protein [Desulfonema limicola]QTA83385.1 tRNA-binding domain-containing protein [Desulfonema limicola]
MKVSLSWLKDYIPVDMGLAELAQSLTMAGLEVDSVQDRYEWLDTVFAGRITKVEKHPNADKLTLCSVDIGEKTVRVVCGAPNVRENMTAPLLCLEQFFPMELSWKKELSGDRPRKGCFAVKKSLNWELLQAELWSLILA